MNREEYTKIIAENTGFSKEKVEKYVNETYMDGYGPLCLFTKVGFIEDINRISDLTYDEGLLYFKSYLTMSRFLSAEAFKKILNMRAAEYLEEKYTEKNVSNNKAIEIQRYVIQCTTNYVDHDKQVYITETGFSINLTDAKLYDSEKNARAAVRYWKKNNKFNKDYCIYRVRQTFEITGIINGGLNDAD